MSEILEKVDTVLLSILCIMICLIVFVGLVVKICEAVDSRRKARLDTRRTLKKLEQFADKDIQRFRKDQYYLNDKITALEIKLGRESEYTTRRLQRIDWQIRNYISHEDPLLAYNDARLRALGKRRKKV